MLGDIWSSSYSFKEFKTNLIYLCIYLCIYLLIDLITEGKQPHLICRADLRVDNIYVSEKRCRSQELGFRPGWHLPSRGEFGQARILLKNCNNNPYLA